MPVGPWLAAQLLLPLALARGGTFRTLAPSPHTQTNLETLQQFLDVRSAVEQVADEVWEIRVLPQSRGP